MDVIALFVQPLSEERIRAHMLLSILDDNSDETTMRAFPTDDIRPGQADPGKPVPETIATRSSRRDTDPGRQVGPSSTAVGCATRASPTA